MSSEDKLYVKAQEINKRIFEALRVDENASKVCALKGGFVLSGFNPVGISARRTMDIDMSVPTKSAYNLVMSILIPLSDKFVSEGIVTDYEVKEPAVLGTKRCSGGISYRYHNPTAKKTFKFCGVDISLFSLDYGVITIADGMSAFSNERSVADKLTVIFNKNSFTIARRCRDLYDLYLFDVSQVDLSVDSLKECLQKNNVDVHKVSNLELCLGSEKESQFLLSELGKLLEDQRHVVPEYVSSSGVTPEVIIKSVIESIDVVRRTL